MPMIYDEHWQHPARTIHQARCAGPNCTPEGLPGKLVMAVTLDERGWCTSCARTVDDTHQKLTLDL